MGSISGVSGGTVRLVEGVLSMPPRLSGSTDSREESVEYSETTDRIARSLRDKRVEFDGVRCFLNEF